MFLAKFEDENFLPPSRADCCQDTVSSIMPCATISRHHLCSLWNKREIHALLKNQVWLAVSDLVDAMSQELPLGPSRGFFDRDNEIPQS